MVEDKDPKIVVIVFFLSVFLSKRVVVTKSDDVSVFFFQLSMRYKKEWIFSGWMGCISLFFILDFFCVILKP